MGNLSQAVIGLFTEDRSFKTIRAKSVIIENLIMAAFLKLYVMFNEDWYLDAQDNTIICMVASFMTGSILDSIVDIYGKRKRFFVQYAHIASKIGLGYYMMSYTITFVSVW